MSYYEEMYYYLSDAVNDSIHILLRRQDISLAVERLTSAQLVCGEIQLRAMEADLEIPKNNKNR